MGRLRASRFGGLDGAFATGFAAGSAAVFGVAFAAGFAAALSAFGSTGFSTFPLVVFVGAFLAFGVSFAIFSHPLLASSG